MRRKPTQLRTIKKRRPRPPRRKDVVIGVDPSSKKLAFVVTVDDGPPRVFVQLMKMKKIEERCASAFEYTTFLLSDFLSLQLDPRDRVWFFIEDAVVGRGGAYSTIAQSKVHGAVVAAAVLSGRCEYVVAENNSRVKKRIVGKGNANKADIKEWARVYWRELFKAARNGADQDLIDAGMHNRFGSETVKVLKRVNANRERLEQ